MARGRTPVREVVLTLAEIVVSGAAVIVFATVWFVIAVLRVIMRLPSSLVAVDARPAPGSLVPLA